MEIPTPEMVMSELGKMGEQDVEEVCGYAALALRQWDGKTSLDIPLDRHYHQRVKNEVAKRLSEKGWTCNWGIHRGGPNESGDTAVVNAKPKVHAEEVEEGS